MTPTLNALAEVIAKANDQFAEKHQTVDTVIGIMDKGLRQQGMAAEALTIDAVTLDKKIVLLVRDETLDVVEVALGNRAGDIFSSEQYENTRLNVELVSTIMEGYFLGH